VKIYDVGLAAFLAIFVIALAIIVAVPLITIWSFYTAWTWLAMFWLQAVLTGSVGAAIRKNRN
jgi:hypothetical protein